MHRHQASLLVSGLFLLHMVRRNNSQCREVVHEQQLTRAQLHPSCHDYSSCANLPSIDPNLPSHAIELGCRSSTSAVPIWQRHRPSLHPTSHWHRCLHPTGLHQPNRRRLHWCRQQGLVRRCRSPGRRWSRCRPLSDSTSGPLLGDGYGRTILHLLEVHTYDATRQAFHTTFL